MPLERSTFVTCTGMDGELEILRILQRHNVPFVIVGGHAVTFHGYQRMTEDIDVVWARSGASEAAVLAALVELGAQYIGREIDPATGIERTFPVTRAYVSISHLMMLWTAHGFIDLFDYVPGLPSADVQALFDSSVESEGFRFASLDWLRQMKKASGRAKDLIDLQKLPGGDA